MSPSEETTCIGATGVDLPLDPELEDICCGVPQFGASPVGDMLVVIEASGGGQPLLDGWLRSTNLRLITWGKSRILTQSV